MVDAFLAALEADDRTALGQLLDETPDLVRTAGQSSPPPITKARSIETAELLLAHGAPLDEVTRWWQEGFGVREVEPEVGRFLASRGASLSPHAASALGLVNELRVMIDAHANLVHAPGGDGCTPLHFARNTAVVDLLLDRGADPDARDQDHASTPTQWLLRDAPEVARHLVERGARPDIFIATALGDRDLVLRLIENDPNCVNVRIGEPPYLIYGHEGRGGSILQWTLAFHSYAHQIAAQRGCDDIVERLFDASDTRTRLLASCLMGRSDDALDVVTRHPTVMTTMSEEDHRLVAYYSWETNNDTAAVRTLLDVGFPVEVVETRHGHMPLHNAAWCGNKELVELLIERGHSVSAEHPDFGNAISFALHSACHVHGHPNGDFGGVFAALIDAGCPWSSTLFPTDNAEIDEVLEPRLRQRPDGAAMLGDDDAIETWLRDSPSEDDLLDALIGAARGGHMNVCQRLLDCGAPIRVGKSGPSTALHQAVLSGSLDVVRLLMSHGADPNLRNAFGSTIVVSCVWGDASAEMLDFVLAQGVDINATTVDGSTPLDIAINNGFDRVAELLRERGGECQSSDSK